MIEICCGSYEDAYLAYKQGIKRVELNSALYLGGLTPSIASLKLVKATTDLEVVAMVRVRGGGFIYSDLEYKQMKVELIDLLENGADGIAFGFLTREKTIDLNRTKEFVEIIHSYHKTAVFHRAFDCVNNYREAIKNLIDLKIDRLLTSGLKPTALKGQETIKELVIKYGNQIEILPGSGINYTNVKELIEKTGVKQIHSSCRSYQEDISTSGKDVTFTYDKNNCYEVVDENLIKKLINVINPTSNS